MSETSTAIYISEIQSRFPNKEAEIAKKLTPLTLQQAMENRLALLTATDSELITAFTTAQLTFMGGWDKDQTASILMRRLTDLDLSETYTPHNLGIIYDSPPSEKADGYTWHAKFDDMEVTTRYTNGKLQELKTTQAQGSQTKLTRHYIFSSTPSQENVSEPVLFSSTISYGLDAEGYSTLSRIEQRNAYATTTTYHLSGSEKGKVDSKTEKAKSRPTASPAITSRRPNK